MLEDEVKIGNDTVRKSVVEDLFALFPHSLTPEQKDRRTATCRDLIATADSDTDFLKKTVTGVSDVVFCLRSDH